MWMIYVYIYLVLEKFLLLEYLSMYFFYTDSSDSFSTKIWLT